MVDATPPFEALLRHPRPRGGNTEQLERVLAKLSALTIRSGTRRWKSRRYAARSRNVRSLVDGVHSRADKLDSRESTRWRKKGGGGGRSGAARGGQQRGRGGGGGRCHGGTGRALGMLLGM
jgi:hypothetical protein